MKYKNIIFIVSLILLFVIPLVAVSDKIEGKFNSIDVIVREDSSTYPQNNIIGTFGKMVRSKYAFGFYEHKKYDFKSLNFYTFPENITNKDVYLDFTVQVFDSEGQKIGEGRRHISSPVPPGVGSGTLHGIKITDSLKSKISSYRIDFIESYEPIKLND